MLNLDRAASNTITPLNSLLMIALTTFQATPASCPACVRAGCATDCLELRG
jgi:hypothetical protein